MTLADELRTPARELPDREVAGALREAAAHIERLEETLRKQSADDELREVPRRRVVARSAQRRLSAVRMMRQNRDDIAKLMGWTSTNDVTLTEKVTALADAFPMLTNGDHDQ